MSFAKLYFKEFSFGNWFKRIFKYKVLLMDCGILANGKKPVKAPPKPIIFCSLLVLSIVMLCVLVACSLWVSPNLSTDSLNRSPFLLVSNSVMTPFAVFLIGSKSSQCVALQTQTVAPFPKSRWTQGSRANTEWKLIFWVKYRIS